MVGHHKRITLFLFLSVVLLALFAATGRQPLATQAVIGAPILVQPEPEKTESASTQEGESFHSSPIMFIENADQLDERSRYIDPLSNTLRSWVPWSPRTGAGRFDLTRCHTLQVGELNGDDLTDLICPYDHGNADTQTFAQLSSPNGYSDWIPWSPRTGGGKFDLAQCRTLQVGELNGDGLTDLICPYTYTGNRTKTWVQISTPEGYTTWIEWGALVIGFEMNYCNTLVIGELNGDGFTDLICPYVYTGSRTKTWVQLSTSGGYTPWTEWGSLKANFSLNNCKTIQGGELNGDGLTDLICPYDEGNKTTTWVQMSGVSKYDDWKVWTLDNNSSELDINGCNVFVRNVNNDGVTDLICLYNYGDGSAQTFVQLSSIYGYTAWVAASPRTNIGSFYLEQCKSLLSGDINGDSLIDLICTYYYGNGSNQTWVQLADQQEYHDWEAESSLVMLNEFDLNRCRASFSANIDGDNKVDIICAYDHGSADAQTWTQDNANSFL